jgi:hypothetical protein
MAEWLRRWTANPLGYARAGSNPVNVAIFNVNIAQLGERKTEDLEVLGSNPGVDIIPNYY